MRYVTFALVCLGMALLAGCGGTSDPSLQSIQVNPHDAQAPSPEGQQNFTANGIFSNNSIRILGSQDGLQWESSNNLVASIDPVAGVATCRAPGLVTITVTASAGVTLNGGGSHGGMGKVVAEAQLKCI